MVQLKCLLLVTLLFQAQAFHLLKPDQRLCLFDLTHYEHYRRGKSVFAISSSSSPADGDAAADIIEKADAIVCGGGPAGLLSAIMLAEKLPPDTNIRVFDRLGEPPGPDDETAWSDVAKFYLIGLGGRGQSALKQYKVWDEVQKRCVAVVGRRDWEPNGPPEGTERIFTKKDKKTTAQVLPRDKLVGVLHQHICENYKDRITLQYGYELRPVDFEYADGSQVLVEISRCSDEVARLNPASVVKVATEEPIDVLCDTENVVRIATDLLVAADGTVRTIANAMEKADNKRFAQMNPFQRILAGKPFRVRRYVDDNQRVYKTIPFKLPQDWRTDVNYSARSSGSKITFDALPANHKGDYCGALLIKKSDDLAQAETDPAYLRKRLDDSLPQFSALLSDEVVAAVAKKPVSYLPGFRYAEPRLHQGNRCVILGDCAHTVKPYFGLGANSALEDVKIFGNILEANKNEDDCLTKSVLQFSKRQAKEAKALVRLSRDLDRPGKLGIFTFLAPLILDSIFHNMLPKFFTPNIISMLQREEYTFQQVGARKRWDRFAQLGLIGSGMGLLGLLIKTTISRFSRWAGLTGFKLWATVALSVASVAFAKKAMASAFASSSASSNDVGNGESFLTPLKFGNHKTTNSNGGNEQSFLTPLKFGNQEKTSGLFAEGNSQAFLTVLNFGNEKTNNKDKSEDAKSKSQ